MRRIGLFLVAGALFAANNAFALSLTIENQTGKELHELYFAPAGNEEWGPDQLGNKIVKNEDTFTLNKIPEGKYDVLFVDENGEKCDIRDVNFKASETFVMTKKIIKGCQNNTDQEDDSSDDEK